MAKAQIDFIGFLLNVDDSITGLNLGNCVSVEKRSQEDVVLFLKKIEFHYGVSATSSIIDWLPTGMVSGCYCVLKANAAQFERTPQGVVVQLGAAQRIHHCIQERLRILRLFKDGNIVLQCSFLYYVKDTKPRVCNLIGEYPVSDRTCFSLVPGEVGEAQAFLDKTALPFSHPYLRLGFDGFDRSYEVHDHGLAYLSLMVGLEAILNAGAGELRYRVSRNVAVLLGRDHAEAKAICKDVRKLYDKRSKLVHTGDKSVVNQDDLGRLRYYLRETIKEAYATRMNKDELLDMLHSSGFGARPRRQGE